MSCKMKKILLALPLAGAILVSCDKVSPIGVLVAGTAVDDRVKMSNEFYKSHMDNSIWLNAPDDYSFIVGADSHLTDDSSRLDEMLALGLEHGDLFYAHLGDIADTKVEYYVTLDSLVQEGKRRYVEQNYTMINDYEYIDNHDPYSDTPIHYTYDEIVYPFFPVVGNHDITHNGWALWSNIFHSSFYEIDVVVGAESGRFVFDHLIFLDSASGTLGSKQIELINKGVLDGKYDDGTDIYRHTFVFTHTNVFRPQFFEFASTFAKEEQMFLLKQFQKWNVTCVFCGHVHTWDERDFNGVHYLTLDTMCEKERKGPGDYLVRVDVKSDGSVTWSPVTMHSTKK